jgi:hypothetical protein
MDRKPVALRLVQQDLPHYQIPLPVYGHRGLSALI